MQDFLLLAAVIAEFVFGWFVMKRVDAFCDEIRRPEPE